MKKARFLEDIRLMKCTIAELKVKHPDEAQALLYLDARLTAIKRYFPNVEDDFCSGEEFSNNKQQVTEKVEGPPIDWGGLV